MNSPLDTAIASILDDVLNETSKMNHLQLDLPDSPPVSPPVEESAAAPAVLFNGTAENHVVLEPQPLPQASTSSNTNATTNFDLHLTANTVNAIHVDHDYLLRGPPPPPNAVHHKSRIRTDDDIILEYCQHNGHEFNLDIASNVELIAEPNNKSPTKQLNSASPTKISKYQMVPKPNKRAQQRQQQFLRHSPQFIINPTSPINSLLPLGLSSPRPKPPKMDLPEIKMRLHDKQKFNKLIRKSESSDSSKGGRPKKGTQMHSELTSGSSSTAGQLDVAQPIKVARIATPRPNMRSAKGPANGAITVRVVPNSSISPSIATAMASTLVSATVMNGIKEKVAEGKLSPLGRSPRTKPDTTPVNYLNKTKKSAATASPKIKKPIGRPRKMPETEPRVKRKYTKRSEKWNILATQKRPRGRPRKDQSGQANVTSLPAPPPREPTPEPEVAEEEDEEEDEHESEEEDQDQGNEVPDSVKDNKVAVVNAGTSSGAAAASTSSSSNRRANPFELVGCQQFEDEDELPFHVKIKADTLAVMDLHAHCLKTEVIGLLGGHYCPITKTVNIRTAEPCPSICNDSIKCEMDPVAQAIALDKLESQNFQVVGWYHSHPTFSPEPSHRDIETQIDYQRMFSEMSPVDGGRPYVAFIISPFIKPDEATVRARMKSATSFTSTLPEQMYAGKRFYSAEKKYAYANFTEVQCRYFTPELNGVLASPYKCFWVANAGAAAGASGSSTAAAAGSTNGTGTEIPYEIQADFTRDSRLIPAIIDKLGPMAMWINRDFPHSVVKLFKTFVRVGSVTVNYLEKIIASLAHHLEASGCAETECERIKQECIAILVEELGTPSDR